MVRDRFAQQVMTHRVDGSLPMIVGRPVIS